MRRGGSNLDWVEKTSALRPEWQGARRGRELQCCRQGHRRARAGALRRRQPARTEQLKSWVRGKGNHDSERQAASTPREVPQATVTGLNFIPICNGRASCRVSSRGEI